MTRSAIFELILR